VSILVGEQIKALLLLLVYLSGTILALLVMETMTLFRLILLSSHLIMLLEAPLVTGL